MNKGIDSTFRNKVQEKRKKFSLLFFIEELYYWSAPQAVSVFCKPVDSSKIT